LRMSKVRTKPSGRSAPSGRTTSERTSASSIVATKPANQAQARPGRSNADRPERREQRPQDHRAGFAQAAEGDGPQRGSDENERQLRRAQEREVLGPREDGQADRGPGDVGPRRERDRVLADGPVQAAPQEPDRQDDQRHPDEQALAEALVDRVVRIRPRWRGPDREAPRSRPASRSERFKPHSAGPYRTLADTCKGEHT
jgi:hypothetical protein